ncbi:homoserine dehydrogenase [Candidatus Woesearchaeota archaeon]|nr:homoserine dehydrogenase [Candidatus Woesearchaeota archaeon]
MWVKVGILGAGTVGSGVFESLTSGHFRRISDSYSVGVSKVLIKNSEKARSRDMQPYLTTSFNEVLEESDIVIELMGGINPAMEYMLEAIRKGKGVITANKAVIASHGKELFEQAVQSGTNIRFGAAAGGGLQLVDRLFSSADNIRKVQMIINATSNYVLTGMKNLQFQEVIAEAQRLGYAEQDYHSDISGIDSAYKLAIVATLAFNQVVDPRKLFESGRVRGIEDVIREDFEAARQFGFDIKLLAIAEKNQETYDIRVEPCFVPVGNKQYGTHQLAEVHGVFNAAIIDGQLSGIQKFEGRGAGKEPTTSAVLYDLKKVLDNMAKGKIDEIHSWSNPPASISDMDTSVVTGCIRTVSSDRPLTVHYITGILGHEGLNLGNVYQKRGIHSGDFTPDWFFFDPISLDAVHRALSKLEASDFVQGKPVFYRIEPELK